MMERSCRNGYHVGFARLLYVSEPMYLPKTLHIQPCFDDSARARRPLLSLPPTLRPPHFTPFLITLYVLQLLEHQGHDLHHDLLRLCLAVDQPDASGPQLGQHGRVADTRAATRPTTGGSHSHTV